MTLTWVDPETSPAEDLVTGVVVGLRGRVRDKGVFEVADICYPELPLQKEWPEGRDKEDKLVCNSEKKDNLSTKNSQYLEYPLFLFNEAFSSL